MNTKGKEKRKKRKKGKKKEKKRKKKKRKKGKSEIFFLIKITTGSVSDKPTHLL